MGKPPTGDQLAGFLRILEYLNSVLNFRGISGIYFTPGTDCEDNIIKRINEASRIEIAVYAITNRNIADAIEVAYKRGAIFGNFMMWNEKSAQGWRK